MKVMDQHIGEAFVRLALAVEEHLPGYVDSYFGPNEWSEEAKQTGKLPLPELTDRAVQLAEDLPRNHEMDGQRKDFLEKQIRAMQMSLRLLQGEAVPLAEEVEGLYDVRPEWKDEANFREAHKLFDQVLPGDGSLQERMEIWDKSLEIPVEKAKELLPLITDRLRALTAEKFDLPQGESFTVEFVSDQPWGAYNWYLGGYRSRIDINTDLPIRAHGLPWLLAHEGYPGHHTELSIKEAKLVRQSNYREHLLTLINAPSCVIAEAIATTALKIVLPDDELEQWYRNEILPRAGLTHIDAARIMEMSRAGRKMSGLMGNAAFMLHDQHQSPEEITAYIQHYGLRTEKEASQSLKFLSNPLYRSYIFTYHIGYDLLDELFTHVDRDTYFRRLLEEPVTPSQVRQWMQDERGTASL